MKSQAQLPVIIIAGPTASGKSALALELAAAFGGIIINADSQQIYRDLKILSARPDDAAMRQVPHRLYGFLDAAERGSVARWRELALVEIATAIDRGSFTRCNALTRGDKTKLRRTASAIGTRISRVKYRAATTTAPIKKFENAKPAGTNTSIYRCEPTRHGSVPPNQWKPVGKVPIHNNRRLRLYPVISEDKCAPRH